MPEDMTVGACATSADCAEVTDGCCMTSWVTSVAEDSEWGMMPAVVAGQQPNMCVSAADQANAEAAVYPMTGLDMMQTWFDGLSEEERAEYELFPEAIFLCSLTSWDPIPTLGK